MPLHKEDFHTILGESKISKFIENLIKPLVLNQDLELAYREMTEGKERKGAREEAKEADVKMIRIKLHLSQEFAKYFGVSARTIQEWEQHRRKLTTYRAQFSQSDRRNPNMYKKSFPILKLFGYLVPVSYNLKKFISFPLIAKQ